MKRFVCVLLVMVLTLSMAAFAEMPEAPSGFKIGFTYVPPSDTLSAAFHSVLDYVAEGFNCEMQYAEIDTTAALSVEGWVNAYENLAQAGCDAQILILCTSSVIDFMTENGIYFTVACSTLDPSVVEQAAASEYYCGNIHEDEVAAGYGMAEALYNAGCRKFVYIAPAAGFAAGQDDRVRGIESFIEEHDDVTLVASYRGADFGVGMNELIAAYYGEFDAVALTTGDASVPSAIYAAGLQNSVKYGCIDLQEGAYEMFEDGMMAFCAAGQYPDMELAFALLYNALASGVKIMPDLTQSLQRPYLYITSVEDFNNYNDLLNGDLPPYSIDEIKELCLAYNPDATAEELSQKLVEYCESYSLQDILERHS